MIDLRDFSFSIPHQHEAGLKRVSRSRRVGIVGGVVAAAVSALGMYLDGDPIYAVGVGVGLFLAIASAYANISKPGTDQFPLCQRCGYNLTGNTTGKCPECGHAA